jgi:muramoyltetrapeptide carboxypeptidase
MAAKRLYLTPTSDALTGPADRARILKVATTWADEFGWEVVASPLLERYIGPGAWLPADERAEDIRRAIEHEIVWACRGGYGAIHLAQALLEAPRDGRPALISYSDPTVLHAIWRRRGWGPALYGSLPEHVDESRRATSLRAIVRGQPYRLSSEHELYARVLRPGRVSAPLFAACLVVLANLCGTPAMPDLRGCLLALEDVDEGAYAIDFALHQLHQAGALDGIAGLLFGSLHYSSNSDYAGPTIDAILESWAERLAIPTVARLPFGHMDDPLVLPSGAEVALEAQAGGGWRLEWNTRPL